MAAASLGLRGIFLNRPAGLVFDEVYYVNAARDLAGRHSVLSPLGFVNPGVDTNPAHPPLAKLLIAGSIRLFGDNPVGWRLPSLIAGTIAIILLYRLVRLAGGGAWTALTAAALMAADNLLFVHSGIATLDIFALTLMLAGLVLYLRGRWALAGIAIAAGACSKLVGADALLIIGLFEGGRLALAGRGGRAPIPGRPPRATLLALAGCTAASAVAYLLLLGGLDRLAGVGMDPITHTRYMMRVLTEVRVNVTSVQGRLAGDSSGPLQWLLDQRPITYWRQPGFGPAVVDIRGVINPVMILAAVPTLVLAAAAAWRQREAQSLLALAWFAGTMLPYAAGAINGRVTYIYYMVTVMPAVYIALARCLHGRPRLPEAVRIVFALGVVYNAVLLFPFRSLSAP